METIKMEDLKVGTKVRIVDEPRTYWVGDEMAKYAGQVMTIRDLEDLHSLGCIRFEEDQKDVRGGWYWGVDSIAEIIPDGELRKELGE